MKNKSTFSIRLRTLAKLSILNFGRYFDLNPQQIVALYNVKGKTYLTWVYYNCSNISFNEEILLELGIKADIRIDKPGCVNSKAESKIFKQLAMKNRIMVEDFSSEEHIKANQMACKEAAHHERAIIAKNHKRSSRFHQKGNLQQLQLGNGYYN